MLGRDDAAENRSQSRCVVLIVLDIISML